LRGVSRGRSGGKISRGAAIGHVRLTPKSGHVSPSASMSAKCQ
jgi:hypothetical protein